MIIGVSGYSNSGKDTVGKIIQELCPTDDWQIKKFAGKLKDIASLLTNIPIEKFEDQEFKKTNLGPEWDYQIDKFNPVQKMTVRELLQKLGTNALRNGLHHNVWVNALMSEYTHTGRYGYDENKNPIYDYPNWVITDTRFYNEAKAIKDKRGIIIRVDRPGVKPINDHPSEIGLDDWNFDYKIGNVSDVISLKFTVETILKNANLL